MGRWRKRSSGQRDSEDSDTSEDISASYSYEDFQKDLKAKQEAQQKAVEAHEAKAGGSAAPLDDAVAGAKKALLRHVPRPVLESRISS